MPAPLNKESTQKNEDTQNLEQVSREISQTDHINKKLLTSLFKRMDEGGNSTLAKMMEPDNNSEENDEWKD